MFSSWTARRWSPTPIRIRLLRLWRWRGAHPNTCSTKPRKATCRHASPRQESTGRRTMSENSVTRRDVLRTLAIGAVSGSVLQVIPAKAAEYAHLVVHNEKSSSPAGKYVPKYFSPHQYEMLTTLCDTIIPKDEKSGGAVEAGAPEFIDLLTSENEEYQLALGGGLMWLDTHCIDQYGKVFMECAPELKKEILDLIAFRKNAKK